MSIKQLFLFTLLLQLGCSIQAPEIKVTGSRSLLERQMLGRYQAFQQDLWMQGSLRAAGDTLAAPEEDNALMRALRRRHFNADDRLVWCAAGWLGESWLGELLLMPGVEIPVEQRAMVERLVTQEAEDRGILLKRLELLYPELSAEESRRLLADLLRQEAPKKCLLEDETGNWRSK
jgi:hypothetical protein